MGCRIVYPAPIGLCVIFFVYFPRLPLLYFLPGDFWGEEESETLGYKCIEVGGGKIKQKYIFARRPMGAGYPMRNPICHCQSKYTNFMRRGGNPPNYACSLS